MLLFSIWRHWAFRVIFRNLLIKHWKEQLKSAGPFWRNSRLDRKKDIHENWLRTGISGSWLTIINYDEDIYLHSLNCQFQRNALECLNNDLGSNTIRTAVLFLNCRKIDREKIFKFLEKIRRSLNSFFFHGCSVTGCAVRTKLNST